jgi:ribosome-associated protein YbcJ (S4-like RNA binding protein)
LDLHFLLLLGLIDSGGAMNAFITDTLIAVRGLTHDLKLRT